MYAHRRRLGWDVGGMWVRWSSAVVFNVCRWALRCYLIGWNGWDLFLPISSYAALPSKRCTSKTGASIEPNRLFGLAKQTIWQGKTTRFISVLPARPKNIPCRRPQRAAQDRQAAAIIRKLFAGPKEQAGQYPDYSVYDNNCTQRLQKKLIDEYYDEYEDYGYAIWHWFYWTRPIEQPTSLPWHLPASTDTPVPSAYSRPVLQWLWGRPWLPSSQLRCNLTAKVRNAERDDKEYQLSHDTNDIQCTHYGYHVYGYRYYKPN